MLFLSTGSLGIPASWVTSALPSGKPEAKASLPFLTGLGPWRLARVCLVFAGPEEASALIPTVQNGPVCGARPGLHVKEEDPPGNEAPWSQAGTVAGQAGSVHLSLFSLTGDELPGSQALCQSRGDLEKAKPGSLRGSGALLSSPTRCSDGAS